jgi:hypothetical protein
VIPLDGRRLRTVLAEHVDSYNKERLHRTLRLVPPLPATRSPAGAGAGTAGPRWPPPHVCASSVRRSEALPSPSYPGGGPVRVPRAVGLPLGLRVRVSEGLPIGEGVAAPVAAAAVRVAGPGRLGMAATAA